MQAVHVHMNLAHVVSREFAVGRTKVRFQAVQLVPGIGTIQGFRASSQASAICAGVACFRSATRSFLPIQRADRHNWWSTA